MDPERTCGTVSVLFWFPTLTDLRYKSRLSVRRIKKWTDIRYTSDLGRTRSRVSFFTVTSVWVGIIKSLEDINEPSITSRGLRTTSVYG